MIAHRQSDPHEVCTATEDNLSLVTDPALVPNELLFMAGMAFERFDPKTCTFISSAKEAYPDN